MRSIDEAYIGCYWTFSALQQRKEESPEGKQTTKQMQSF